MDDFAKNLYDLRKWFGYTQEELAIKIGVKKRTVGMWETGQRMPRAPMLEKIADTLNVSMDTLTKEKQPAESTDELPVLDLELKYLLKQVTPLEAERVKGYIRGVLENRSD